MLRKVTLVFAWKVFVVFISFPQFAVPHTEQHLNLDFGTGDMEKISIVYPRIYETSIRKRRNVYSDVYYQEVFKAKSVGVGDWILELEPEGNLMLASGVKTEWIGDKKIRKGPPQCFYGKGTIGSLKTRSVFAVTLCGNSVTGYIQVDDKGYIIEPLNETSGSHLLYKSKTWKLRSKRSKTPVNNFKPRGNTSPPEWMYNLTGDTIELEDIGGESGLDQISDEDAESYAEKEDNITGPAGNISSREMPPHYWTRRQDETGEWNRELVGDDENGYFYDSAWTTGVVLARKSVSSTLTQRWLKIAVIADQTLVAFHGRDKVERYVLSLMNIVSAIYQDTSLEANMKLVVTRLQIHEHKRHPVIRPGYAKKSLENVNSWNRRLHASLAPGEPKHDIAVWLTRSDIGGPSGYAPVGGTCDPKRSCALNRDEGLTSAFIIAHEVAHILGLSHDGDLKNGNKCDSESQDGYVMAPMVSATFGKFSWSECSKSEFRDKVSKWTCLLDSPQSGDIPLNATLQTAFSMDEQCRMEFGDGYSMCRAFDIFEPCSHLWCGHVKSPLVCKTKKGPPLEGTECGFGKWCVNGYCAEVGQTRQERVPVVLNPQDGGWSEWGPWGLCSRTCGTGVRFRSRKCNNPTPSYGGKSCNGETEEWDICNINPCADPHSDLRAQQCKRLPKLFGLSRNDTWLPYESGEEANKCKFICMSEERKELFITNDNLIDGTRCSYENQDNICVQGKCQIIGCDGKLRSGIQRDRCGVCNGNNTNCSEIKFAFTRKLKRDVSRLAVLPRMAREIKLEINVTMHHSENPSVAILLKNRYNRKYTVTVPNTVLHTKISEGTSFFYKKYGNIHKIWAKGPIWSEIVVMLIASNSDITKGLTLSYITEYSIHNDYLVPSKRFTWIIGGWGPCSSSCGGGIRRKTVACWDNQSNKIIKKKHCSLFQKPFLETGKCNEFDCNFQWIAGDWEPCSHTCGTSGVQQREIYCVPNSALNDMLFKNNVTSFDEPWKYMVSPNKCPGIRSGTIRSCNRVPCFSYWEFGNWTQCSTSCGPGISSRSVNCQAPQGESFYTCGEVPPPQRRSCMGVHKGLICKGTKRRICQADQSKYCSLPSLFKYCKLKGYRRLCCKTCSSYQMSEAS